MSAPTTGSHVYAERTLLRMLALAVNILARAAGETETDGPEAEIVTASDGIGDRMEPAA